MEGKLSLFSSVFSSSPVRPQAINLKLITVYFGRPSISNRRPRQAQRRILCRKRSLHFGMRTGRYS
jgi:hypothetical protein